MGFLSFVGSLVVACMAVSNKVTDAQKIRLQDGLLGRAHLDSVVPRRLQEEGTYRIF